MAEDATPTEGNADEEGTDGTSGELGDAGKRALEAERKARRTAEKELKALRDKVKEREDLDKSELERLQDRIAEAAKRAEDAEAKANRYEVAAAKGLTPAQAKRLVGSTREELEADADEMRAELGLDKKDDETKDEETKDEETTTGRPKERLKSGASPDEDAEEPDAGKLADSILGSKF